ncbi:hypothetical protein LL037_14855 [Clostridium estertheticum]|uniref:immunity protein Imm33 domain-containing protein n=1 Tax=Clostridium estertheticum TaxID=238834 RepID=UPI001C0B868D|nr:hypothetical protein [Clostridium estertheticum]MBU3202158.1 hypothetical protein [Clostridium estertheticum]WAG63760.1 hypothetical protein LL037_14855 [Clostridium estertheticum]
MINITRSIDNKLFIAKTENYLAEQAESLLELISRIEVKKLKNNFKTQIGFSIFTILEENDGIHVIAPDYKNNPFKDKTDDLTIHLWIQLEQGQLLKQIKLEGEMISFQDKIICAKGVLELDDIYLERNEDHEEGDSGWYIGPVNETISNEELEAYYTYQLLKIRPELIKTLSIPCGYMVVFNKDKIVAILDKNDIDIFKK